MSLEDVGTRKHTDVENVDVVKSILHVKCKERIFK